MHLSRRSFFLGAGALVAAPSIVRTASLMPVKVPKFVPEPWLVCDGRAVLKRHYPDLFRIIGNVYGGDGTQHFNLPDTRGGLVRPGGMLQAQYVIATADQAAIPAGMITVRHTP